MYTILHKLHYRKLKISQIFSFDVKCNVNKGQNVLKMLKMFQFIGKVYVCTF